MSRVAKYIAPLLAVVFAAALLTGCGGIKPATDIPAPKGNLAAETTETSVFYSTGRSLYEEKKVVDANNPYESTLKELLRALPESKDQIAIVQPEAGFNSVTVDKNGVATIDWKKEVLSFDAEPKEKRLAFASILMTFGQWPDVKKVKFTVDGKDSGKVDGKDIQKFWGAVALYKQPFSVMRPPKAPAKGEMLEQQQGGGSSESSTTK